MKLMQLAEATFTKANSAVLVGGPGTGKTHHATAIGVRAHQRDDHDQSGLRGMVQRFR